MNRAIYLSLLICVAACSSDLSNSIDKQSRAVRSIPLSTNLPLATNLVLSDRVIMEVKAVNNELFILATDSNNLALIYRSNGTQAGTSLISVLGYMGNCQVVPNTGKNRYSARHTKITQFPVVPLCQPRLAVANGMLFATAQHSDQTGFGLWQVYPGDPGTGQKVLLKNFIYGSPQPVPNVFIGMIEFPDNYAGKLFFIPYESEYGLELWTSDGTEAGTRLVTDVNPGAAHSWASILAFTATGAIFAARNASGFAIRHVEDTTVTVDTALDSRLDRVYGESWSDGTHTYFVASDFTAEGDSKDELWTFNHQTQVASPVKIFTTDYALSNYIYLYGITDLEATTFYFMAEHEDKATSVLDIWLSDGTANGTELIDVPATVTSDWFVNYGGTLVLAGQTQSAGRELFAFSPGLANYYIVKNISGGGDSSLSDTTRLARMSTMSIDRIYFAASSDKTRGYNLWSTDGTSDGTYEVAALSGKQVDPTTVMTAGNYVVFNTLETSSLPEIWVYQP